MASLRVALCLATLSVAAAVLNVNAHTEKACTAEDLKRRAQLQNKLAGICEDMCKEVQAYPQCSCPDFVEPDSTPGVMTWDELLAYMDQLAQWGRDSIKGWHKQASQLQVMKNSTAGKKAEVTKNSTAAKKAEVTNSSNVARRTICTTTELDYAESSSAGGSGGVGAYQPVSGAADSCIAITGAVKVKLCGPADVHLYDTAGCPGSPVESIEEAANTNNVGAEEDCIVASGNFVSLKYTCPSWR